MKVFLFNDFSYHIYNEIPPSKKQVMREENEVKQMIDWE